NCTYTFDTANGACSAQWICDDGQTIDMVFEHDTTFPGGACATELTCTFAEDGEMSMCTDTPINCPVAIEADARDYCGPQPLQQPTCDETAEDGPDSTTASETGATLVTAEPQSNAAD